MNIKLIGKLIYIKTIKTIKRNRKTYIIEV